MSSMVNIAALQSATELSQMIHKGICTYILLFPRRYHLQQELPLIGE